MTTTALLDLLVLVPLAACLIAAFTGSRAGARSVAVGAVIVQLGLLGALTSTGVFSGAAVAGSTGLGGVPIWSLMTDGVSTPLLVLTPVVALIGIASAWDLEERPVSFYALLMLLQAAVTAVFLAENIILFYVAWEAVLVPMYFLIGGWGHENRKRAAIKFFLFTFAGSAFMLVGLLVAVVQTQSFSITQIVERSSIIGDSTIVFWLIMLGLLVKIPVVPLHTWLPDAHVEAPTAGSIVLAGVLLKMGGYGILRLAWPIAPQAFDEARGMLLALGIVGVVWGAAMALVQNDLKRLIAYSSVSHMGFVVLAIAAASVDALGAAMIAMVSHGLVAALQFYLVGSLYRRTHTRELALLGGLGSVVPVWSVAFVFGAMASLGLPGLSGFPGEFVSILETYRSFGWWAAAAAVGVVLAAAYGLRAVRETVQGEPASFGALTDLDRLERVTSLAVAAGIVVLGLAPWIVLQVSGPALAALASLIGVTP